MYRDSEYVLTSCWFLYVCNVPHSYGGRDSFITRVDIQILRMRSHTLISATKNLFYKCDNHRGYLQLYGCIETQNTFSHPGQSYMCAMCVYIYTYIYIGILSHPLISTTNNLIGCVYTLKIHSHTLMSMTKHLKIWLGVCIHSECVLTK